MSNIVFDMDDILWGLNEKATKILGIDFNKIICPNARHNPLLTDKEKDELIAMYGNPDLWKDVVWYDGATNIRDLEKYGHKVWIKSNCMNTGVRDFKDTFTSPTFNLPKDQIILDISQEAKTLMEDVLIFCDDLPPNILNSTAKYTLFLDKPWNQDVTVGIRCYSFAEMYQKIEQLIEKENGYVGKSA